MENRKKPSRRDFLKLAGAASGTSILAACAPAQPAATAVPAATAAPAAATETTEFLKAEITVWFYPDIPDANAAENFYTNTIKAQFAEKFPGIKVNIETLTWDGGPDKVNVAIASGTTPDVLYDSPQRVYGYVGKGLMEPINDVIESIKDSIYESLWDIASIDGQRYTAAINQYIPGIAINKTLAMELGTYDMLPKDRKFWTFDEYKAFLKACTEKGKDKGIYGTALWAGSQSADTTTLGFLMIGGANVFNEDKTQVVLNSPQAVKALEFLVSLVKEGIVAPGAANLKDEDEYALFLSKKIVAETIGTISAVKEGLDSAAKGEGDFEVELYEYPMFDSTTPRNKVAIYFPTGLSIFKNSGDLNKIAAAKEFIKFFIGTDSVEKEYLGLTGQVSGNPKIDMFSDNPTLKKEFGYLSSWSGNAIAAYGQEKAYWSELRSVFFPEIQAAYIGTKTAQQALDDYCKNANEIVAENEK